MRAILQRVKHAEVVCSSGKVAKIGRGYLVLLGISRDDDASDVTFMAKKIPDLRLFPDADGVMNLSLLEMNSVPIGTETLGSQNSPGEILLISQFTLHADTRKGRRPHYGRAAAPEQAVPLYEACLNALEERGLNVGSGVFGDHMDITLCADGPVTIHLDSRQAG